jgi:arsenate reductase
MMRGPVLAMMMMAMMVTSSAAQTPPRTVLFVCEHGAAKSVVAAAHFNRLAAERGLPFRAVSRGTAPDATVPARITQGLHAEGLNISHTYTPVLVTAADAGGAARVITFDVSLPFAHDPAAVSSWNGLPAFSEAYQPASAAIAAKVDALLRDLEKIMKKR